MDDPALLSIVTVTMMTGGFYSSTSMMCFWGFFPYRILVLWLDGSEIPAVGSEIPRPPVGWCKSPPCAHPVELARIQLLAISVRAWQDVLHERLEVRRL